MFKKIPKALQEKIETEKVLFRERTLGKHLIEYCGGFVAAGVEKEPKDHIDPALNTILLEGVRVNDSGKDVEETFKITMTEMEARDLVKCLKTALKNHPKFYERITFRQALELAPRKRIKKVSRKGER